MGSIVAGIVDAAVPEQPAMTPTEMRAKIERLRRKSCLCFPDRRRLVKIMSDPNGSNMAMEMAAACDADIPGGGVSAAPAAAV